MIVKNIRNILYSFVHIRWCVANLENWLHVCLCPPHCMQYSYMS